uniref:Alpha-glucosyltransferase alg-10 n=1 Tax=Colletotrichum fructicola (strain Nara gc5) TaxID=1213859 RepID=L2GI32_COLFN
MVTPPRVGTLYPTYRSKFGPKYNTVPNVAGWTVSQVIKLNLNTLFRSAGHPRSRPKAGAGHGLRFSGATRRWKTTYLESQVLTFYFSGVRAGGFGAAAGIAALFYTSGIPRIQKDILQKIPILGNQFVKEVHPADNPF